MGRYPWYKRCKVHLSPKKITVCNGVIVCLIEEKLISICQKTKRIAVLRFANMLVSFEGGGAFLYKSLVINFGKVFLAIVLFMNFSMSEVFAGLAEEIAKQENEIQQVIATRGEKDPSVLARMLNLASDYSTAGRINEAVALDEKTLRLMTEVLGENHENTLLAMSNLAGFYRAQKKYADALTLDERAFALNRDKLGEKKEATLNNMHALAMDYHLLGRLPEALTLYEKTCPLMREILGERHYNTLSCMNNSGLLYRTQRRVEEALVIHEKAYSLTREVFGEGNSLTIKCKQNVELDKMALQVLGIKSKNQVQGVASTNLNNEESMDSLTTKAAELQEKGNTKEALLLLEKVLVHAKEKFGEKNQVTILTMQNIGSVYFSLGRFLDAATIHETARVLSLDLLGEKHQMTLSVMVSLAQDYRSLNRISESAALTEKALPILLSTKGEKDMETLACMDGLALDYYKLGKYVEAAAVLEKIVVISPDVFSEKDIRPLTYMDHLATVYREVGRLPDAIRLSEKTLILTRELKGEKSRSTLVAMNTLAANYMTLGRYFDAVMLHEKALQLSKELYGEKNADTLSIMSNLAVDYRNLGRANDAMVLNEKILEMRIEVLGDKHPDTIASRVNLAVDFFERDRFKESAALNEKAFAQCREVLGERHQYTIKAMQNLARDYRGLGRLKEAVSLHEKALALRQETLGVNQSLILSGMSELAKDYLAQNELGKAVPLYRSLIDGLEGVRKEFGILYDDSKQAWFAQQVTTYKDALFLFNKQGLVGEAFRLSELSKARLLLDRYTIRIANESGIINSEESEKIKLWQIQLAAFDHQIGQASSAQQQDLRIRLETDRNAANQAYQAFQQGLRERYPKYKQFSEVNIVDVNHGKSLLPANSIFISYVQHEKRLLAFILQPHNGLNVVDFGELPKISTMIADYQRMLSYSTIEDMQADEYYLWNTDDGLYMISEGRNKPEHAIAAVKDNQGLNRSRQVMADYLGAQLIEPLGSYLDGKKKWIISPDGALTVVPFETLTYKGQAAVVSADISYIQSLSMLSLLANRDNNSQAGNNRKTLLAIGNPLYSENGENNSQRGQRSIKDTINNSLSRGETLSGKSIDLTSLTWENLNYSADEVRRVVSLFPQLQTSSYLKEDATEAKLQELNKDGILSQFRYILFSTHGIFIPESPLLSAIVLGQKNNPPGTDGYITVGKWPGYNLNSDMVFLAACETGLGKSIEGEGIVGLPFALYMAGNKNTVMTLWKVNDSGTADFSVKFFEKIKSGQDQISAINEVKREMLKGENATYRSPYIWAPFILYGI